MKGQLASFALAFIFGVLSLPTLAHHGTNAEYDSEHPVVFKATVTEFAFSNPHVQIYFDVRDDKGKVIHWAVEAPSPGRLIRMGWTRDEVKAGDQITITVEPARNGAAVGALRKLVLPTGKEMGVVPLVTPQ
jgi:uncharacterized protein DUF6152